MSTILVYYIGVARGKRSHAICAKAINAGVRQGGIGLKVNGFGGLVVLVAGGYWRVRTNVTGKKVRGRRR